MRRRARRGRSSAASEVYKRQVCVCVCVCVLCACVCVCVSIQAAAENSEDSKDELAGHGDDDVKLGSSREAVVREP